MSSDQSERATGRANDYEAVEIGMPLLAPTGEVVGRVKSIDNRTAYVQPAPGVLDGSGPRIAPNANVQDPFVLDFTAVAEVGEDGIRLRPPELSP